jgi:hypothetical protein
MPHTPAARRHHHWRRALRRVRLLRAVRHPEEPPGVEAAAATPGRLDTEGHLVRVARHRRRRMERPRRRRWDEES